MINNILKIKIYSPIIKHVKLYFKKVFFIPFVSKISFRNKKISQIYNFLMIGKFVKKKLLNVFEIYQKLDDKFNIKATIIGEVSIQSKKSILELKA